MDTHYDPTLKVSRAVISKLIEEEMVREGMTLHDSFHRGQEILSSALSPTQIAAAFSSAEESARALCNFYETLSRKASLAADRIIAEREAEQRPQLDQLTSEKARLSDQCDGKGKQVVGGYVTATGVAIMMDICTTGGILTLGTWVAGIFMGGEAIVSGNKLESALKAVEAVIDGLRLLVAAEEGAKTKDMKILSGRGSLLTLLPRVCIQKCEHSRGIRATLLQYAVSHGVTPDEVADFLSQTENENSEATHLRERCLTAFRALLKADYGLADLAALREYATIVSITDHPAQHALLQFVNHALAPHQDYFEIWASKTHDLSNAMAEIMAACRQDGATRRPALEILGEKPVSLCGQFPSQALAGPAQTSLTTDGGVIEISLKPTEAEAQIAKICAILNDRSLPIAERHDAVRGIALEQMDAFIRHFGDVGDRLAAVDHQLGKLVPLRDRISMLWDRAKANATSLALLHVSEPDDRHKLHTKMNWASVGAGVAVDALLSVVGFPPGVASSAAFGRLAAGEIRNLGQRFIANSEYAIKLESLDERNRLNPEELKQLRAELAALDNAFKKLSDDQAFLKFLSGHPAVEQIKALYLLLPRLVAAGLNIDALKPRMWKAGYTSLEDFLGQLRARDPRAGDAMDHFLLGCANTNDLTVLVAEANMIAEPREAVEKVLVEYVERIVKKHYSDYARQASILDYLEMRNVTGTMRPFYSVDEMVKLSTDAPLRALLDGVGDFSLVGSSDVQEIFGDYQRRRGDDFLVDPHAPHDSGCVGFRRIQVQDPEEISTKNAEFAFSRRVETKIPRLRNGIFIEVCVYEYLLPQGTNIVKDRRLITTPHALGAIEMVNGITLAFTRKLCLEEARRQVNGTPMAGSASVGRHLEWLLAGTFVDFFSELGARHSADPVVLDRLKEVRTAFTGENFSLATDLYAEVISELAEDSFDLLLETYHYNLEKYLGRATREDRTSLLEQIRKASEIMKHLQPKANTVFPGTEASRLAARYRDHSLTNVGTNLKSWHVRARAIHAANMAGIDLQLGGRIAA